MVYVELREVENVPIIPWIYSIRYISCTMKLFEKSCVITVHDIDRNPLTTVYFGPGMGVRWVSRCLVCLYTNCLIVFLSLPSHGLIHKVFVRILIVWPVFLTRHCYRSPKCDHRGSSTHLLFHSLHSSSSVTPTPYSVTPHVISRTWNLSCSETKVTTELVSGLCTCVGKLRASW